MRRAKREERAALAALMFDQFYDQAELQQQFSGIDPETARQNRPDRARPWTGLFLLARRRFRVSDSSGRHASRARLQAQMRSVWRISARSGNFSMPCVTATHPARHPDVRC